MFKDTIKTRIKDLLNSKKINKSKLSLRMGKNKAFVSIVLNQEGKYFNLDHLNEICEIIDYPVYKLFMTDKNIPEDGINVAKSEKLPYNAKDSYTVSSKKMESLLMQMERLEENDQQELSIILERYTRMFVEEKQENK